MCGHYGVLEWNPKGTTEGEITCSKCDCDYSVSGMDKWEGGARAWLTTYIPPEPAVETPTTITTPPPVQKTPLEQYQELLNQYRII